MLAATLIAGCDNKDDPIAQAEKKDVARGVAAPSIPETKAIAEEAFIYGLPIVMNYAVMYEFAADTKSSQFKARCCIRAEQQLSFGLTCKRDGYERQKSANSRHEA